MGEQKQMTAIVKQLNNNKIQGLNQKKTFLM